MSTAADKLKRMSASELYDASHGKGGAVGAEAAIEELKRRGFAPEIDSPPAPATVSADAHFIAISAKADAGRIIKHLWIIFVLLPVVLGILYAILK